MWDLIKPLYGFALFVLIVIGAQMIPSLSDNAAAQGCSIGICKHAEGAGKTLFPFTADEGGEISEFEVLDLDAPGACRLVNFDSSAGLVITEDAIPGWQLDNVECDTSGINFSLIEGGVSLECVGIEGGFGDCSFTNVRGGSAAVVPSLSEWGMIAAAAGLVLVGVFFAVRRRKAVVN